MTPSRPRVIDVASMGRGPAPPEPPEPKSYDEGVALRARLIEEVEAIQDQLAERRGRSEEHTDDWRDRARTALRHKRAELRTIKEWLRTHYPKRQTEWELLGRVYGVLSAVMETARTPDGSIGFAVRERWEEIESVLDAIERTVPGRHLTGGKVE